MVNHYLYYYHTTSQSKESLRLVALNNMPSHRQSIFPAVHQESKSLSHKQIKAVANQSLLT